MVWFKPERNVADAPTNHAPCDAMMKLLLYYGLEGGALQWVLSD